MSPQKDFGKKDLDLQIGSFAGVPKVYGKIRLFL